MTPSSLSLFSYTMPLTAPEVGALAHDKVEVDWFGSAVTQPFRWCLAKDPERLWCSIELPASPGRERRHGPGEYVEGLFKSDVVELFLMGPDGRYQEWNFSVEGAWWAMSFPRYREADRTSIRPAAPHIEVITGLSSWRVIAGLPLEALTVQLGGNVRAHVSGIFYGAGAPRYLSSFGAPATKPDFHNAEYFRRIAVVPVAQ